jgi:hypothetical protein
MIVTGSPEIAIHIVQTVDLELAGGVCRPRENIPAQINVTVYLGVYLGSLHRPSVLIYNPKVTAMVRLTQIVRQTDYIDQRRDHAHVRHETHCRKGQSWNHKNNHPLVPAFLRPPYTQPERCPEDIRAQSRPIPRRLEQLAGSRRKHAGLATGEHCCQREG